MKLRFLFYWLSILAIISLTIVISQSSHKAVLKASSGAADMGLGWTSPFSTTDYWYPQIAYWAPLHYLRTSGSWDAFGTWNGSSCVTPTVFGPQANRIINQIAEMERAGQVPVLVLGADIWGVTDGYSWPTGAQVGAVPSDMGYACGVTKMIETFRQHGIMWSSIRLEAWNEPDNSVVYLQPEQAAHFVGDAIYGGGRNFVMISGVFESPYNDGYIDRYVKYLRTYNWDNGVWDVHDYNDVIYGANHGCDPTYAQGCSVAGIKHFLWKLGSDGTATDKVWITETGDPAYQGWVNHSRWEEAHAAWNFEKLRWSGVRHILWYQWRRGQNDPWDSALEDISGLNRPSFCVITYNEVPSWGVNDGRCTASAHVHKHHRSD